MSPSENKASQGPSIDFGRTGREEDVIKAKENELLMKAKQLENEMLAVRQAKVNSVLR